MRIEMSAGFLVNCQLLPDFIKLA